jgi:hypothetical protein
MYKTPISCRDNHTSDGKYSKMNENECNLGIERDEARFVGAFYSLPFVRAVVRHQSLSAS